MTSRQESKLNMYNAVSHFCADNSVLINTLPAFTAAVTAFDTKLQAIDDTAQLEIQVITGVTINKADLKKSLIATALANAAALFAFATSSNNLILKEKARYTVSDLVRLKDDELTLVVQNIHDDVNAVVASLASYGITAITLASFQSLLTDYSTNVSSPRNAVSQRVAYKAQLKSLFSETDTFLKEVMDKLAFQLLSTAPTFYNAYKNNRIVIDPGTSITQLIGTTTKTEDDLPLIGATVMVVEKNLSAISNAFGGYSLPVPDPGIYTVLFSKAGYEDKTVTGVTITLGQTTTLDAELTLLPR